MKRTASFGLIVVLMCLLTACPAARPPTINVAANWNGTVSISGGDSDLLTLTLEQSGMEVEGLAVLGPVSERSHLGLLAGEVSEDIVNLDFAVLVTGGDVALYSLAGRIENDLMRGEVTRRILHETSQGTFELTRER